MSETLTGPDGAAYAVVSETNDGVESFSVRRLSDYWESVDYWTTVADAKAAILSDIGGPGVVALAFERTLRAIALESVLKTRAIDETECWAKFQKLCGRYRVLPLWGQLRKALGYLVKAGAVKVAENKIIRA